MTDTDQATVVGEEVVAAPVEATTEATTEAAPAEAATTEATVVAEDAAPVAEGEEEEGATEEVAA